MLIPTFQVAWLFTLSKSSGSTFIQKHISSNGLGSGRWPNSRICFVNYSFLKARIEIEMSLMRERKREREREVKDKCETFISTVSGIKDCHKGQQSSHLHICTNWFTVWSLPIQRRNRTKTMLLISSSFHWSRKCFWLLALSSLEIHIFVDFLLLSILWVKKFPWHVFLAFLCWISGA